MKIAILGPPGSGKGTVSAKLAIDFNLQHVSAGDLLRKEIRSQSEIGKKIKNTVERGNLVPDELITNLMKKAANENFIYDGFPRTLVQAKNIDDLDMVIYLELPQKAVVKRLSLRRMNPKTGKIYHLKYIPPPKGIELVQRKDDQPIAIKERYQIFLKQTEPAIDYYKKKGNLKIVDGLPAPDVVYESVKKIVSNK
jgi:adenylate kinase